MVDQEKSELESVGNKNGDVLPTTFLTLHLRTYDSQKKIINHHTGK
jgi:hypothetical protein